MASRATSSTPPPADAVPVSLSELPQPANETAAKPGVIAGRYHVIDELGRGGMATVFRVRDAASGNELALKQLQVPDDGAKRAGAEALFETEFQALAQLHHPRVIQVYDYGIAAGRAYYTMELLDGGDLSEHSPMPWRQACTLIYEVCSSLALLHSRRLVHRDVSPRNIRRTRDGLPKLIDFGAMAAMGPCPQAVGTPAFVAPEVAQRASLDGRTDLFSLGGTLYYALTGRPPFPARSFGQLHEAWSVKPAPPSAYVGDIPAALDGLVLSMVSLEPALRPRSAYDVMQRLAAIADIQQDESLAVSRAYLATPTLVGREDLLARVGRRAQRAAAGVGSALILEGPAGIGRSRALDACVLQLKTSGIVTLRGSGKLGARKNLALAQSLAEQLFDALPAASIEALQAEGASELLIPIAAESGESERYEIAQLNAAANERMRLLDQLAKWFLRVARTHTLAIAADDVDHADDASVAFLAVLAERARTHRMLLLATAHSSSQATPALAVQVLLERSKAHALSPLTAEQTEALFDSVFGDVPHVGLVSDRIHKVSLGNPQMSMELAQHLVNQRAIVYDGGTWSLPPSLEAAALPSSLEAAFVERVARLSPLARRLAECHALSVHRELTRDDHRLLAGNATVEATSQALSELVEHGILASDGLSWKLDQRSFVPVLLRGMTDAEKSERHLVLGELHDSTSHRELPAIHHLLCAGASERGLDRLAGLLERSADSIEGALRAYVSPRAACELLERGLAAAESSKRPARFRFELRRWITLIGVQSENESYLRIGPGLFERLRRDSGLADYEERADLGDKGGRLMAALQAAAQRHAAAAPEDKVYPPDEAIRHLVMYVAVSIAVGARTVNVAVLRSLPSILEPFAPLSPLIDAIWHNAIATCEASLDAQFFQARQRWLNVMERLSKVEGDALRYVDAIRYAIVFALGCLEAGRGFPTAEGWAKQLDNDPLQKISGMYLRKVARLQLGDWEGAERFRREAELLSVQANAVQLIGGAQLIELVAHAMANDLPGVKQCAARIENMAQKYAGWRPHALLATGYFELLRGHPKASLGVLETALDMSQPDPNEPNRSLMAWPSVAGAYIQALLAIGRYEDARSFGERTLAEGERRGVHTLDDVVRGMALAEARLGDYAGACARLQVLIDRQLGFGVTGLHLGASYEARARIAIIAGDQPAVEIYGRMTAEQYRHGRGSPLGARYEALMAEARRAGVQILPALSNFETHTIGLTEVRGGQSTTFATVSSSLRTINDREHRLQRALRLLCGAYDAQFGHLYLVQENGLVLEASTDATPPADAQLALARRCLDQALREDELATELVSDTTGLGQGLAVIWTEQGGLEHRSLLISGSVNGELRHAGVVVLVAPATSGDPDAVATLRAVGELLLERGDTPGLIAFR